MLCRCMGMDGRTIKALLVCSTCHDVGTGSARHLTTPETWLPAHVQPMPPCSRTGETGIRAEHMEGGMYDMGRRTHGPS